MGRSSAFHRPTIVPAGQLTVEDVREDLDLAWQTFVNQCGDGWTCGTCGGDVGDHEAVMDADDHAIVVCPEEES